MAENKNDPMVRLKEDVKSVLQAAAKKSGRSLTTQVDWVLRRAYDISPIGSTEAESVIQQIQAGKEFEITPNAIAQEGNGTDG